MRNFYYTALTAVFSVSTLCGGTVSAAADNFPQTPLLIIGASMENGSTPIHDDLSAPAFGASVNAGSYLSIGDALQRSDLLNGFVINEARAGSTTFSRAACSDSACTTAGWQGYDVQLQKALLRVAMFDPQNPGNVAFNAEYVFIGLPNDCLHSSAFGIPTKQTVPCDTRDFHKVADNVRNVAMLAMSRGLTPVIPTYPDYDDIDLDLLGLLFGYHWVIDEAGADELGEIYRERLQAELPGAIILDDLWEDYNHIGDGLHPDPKTAQKAARKIALAIRAHNKAGSQKR